MATRLSDTEFMTDVQKMTLRHGFFMAEGLRFAPLFVASQMPQNSGWVRFLVPRALAMVFPYGDDEAGG